MMVYLVYFNMFRAFDIVNNPLNARANAFEDRMIRGSIVARNGEVLAETVVHEDESQMRNYPQGSVFAHVIGYSSPSFGRMGLEYLENPALLRSNAPFLEQFLNELHGNKNIGDTVVTTLDADLQRIAYNALGDNNGAIVVLEASTGKILAWVSKPTFDPNGIEWAWPGLNQDEENSPLLNRVTQGSYAPGSTFKAVTSLAYMRQDANFADFRYDCGGVVSVDGMRIACFNHMAHGHQDLRLGFANSCNGAYGMVGSMLDPNQFRSTAEDLLFNQELPSLLPYTHSSFRLNQDSGIAERMMTAIGQGYTMTSPYHMALITSAIANGGVLMEPYLVDTVTNHTGTVIHRNMPIIYDRIMSIEEAAVLRDDMRAVVTEGTGTQLAGLPVTMAGKTGTAEISSVDNDRSHSWFIGFTNIDNPELVISIIIEGSDGTDGARAVPIVHQIFSAYYQ